MNLTERVCKNVKGFRVKVSLSQSEAARLCGLQPAAWNHLERGRREPSFETLEKVANVLKVEPWELLK